MHFLRIFRKIEVLSGFASALPGTYSELCEVGLFLFGEKHLGPKGHWLSAFLVFLGSWLSGYFIIATDAWMQHPVGYALGAAGEIRLASVSTLLFNRWALWQYAHNMIGAVQTACFVMAAVGAFYLLSGQHETYGRTFVRVAVILGVVASIAQAYPTGDAQGKMIARHQPVTLAAMEGLFETQQGAPLAI